MTTKVSIAHDHFGAVMTLLDHPSLLLGTRGEVVRYNAQFEEIIGLQDFDIVGHSISDLLVDKHKAPFQQFATQCEKDMQGLLQPFNCIIAHKTSTLALLISPLKVDGVLLGYLCKANLKSDHQDLKLKYLMDHLDQGVWDYDTTTGIFVVSEAWLRMRGMTREDEILNRAGAWLEDIHPDDRAALKQVFEGQTRGTANTVNIQYRRRHQDGHWFWVLCCSKVMATDKDGLPTRIVGTDSDITDLRQNEAEMAQLAAQLRLAIDASGMGIWEFDPNTGTVFWDDTMLEMYGLSDGKNDRCGELWETYLHPDDLEETLAYSDHCQKNGLDFRRDYRVIRPDGSVRHIRSRASQVPMPGRLPKLVGANIDVTEDYRRAKELERAQAQLLHDSRHDALTGLANRRLLDETAMSFLQWARDDDVYCALHLDLDHFKSVNDTLGHAAGDAALTHVAQILLDIIGERGLVSRMGGDEFTVFMNTAPELADLNDLCFSIIDAVGKPIPFDDTSCMIGVSIGGAIGRGPTDNLADIFKKADAALYEAKSAGRNCHRIHPFDEDATHGRAKQS